MSRQRLETCQVAIYGAAAALGLTLGIAWPAAGAAVDTLVWPALGVLLYATFSQVELARARWGGADARLLVAALLGNFLLVPLLVLALTWLLPDDPAVRLGVLLVLLVPCTDWFVTFTHAGGGDTRRAIALVPISLLLQILLLPVYLGLFHGADFLAGIATTELLTAFVGLIVVPLLLAGLTRRWAAGRGARQRLLDGLAWAPVPLLALVVFLVAASQVTLIAGSLPLLGQLVLVFAAYLVAAAGLAVLLARLFRLPVASGRVLAFSLGSRNSFVVLPIALALPASFEIVAVVVVVQSLVELLGMLAYLHWVPSRLFPEPAARPG